MTKPRKGRHKKIFALPVSPLTRLLLVFAIFNPINVTYASSIQAPTIKMITITIIEILYPSSSISDYENVCLSKISLENRFVSV